MAVLIVAACGGGEAKRHPADAQPVAVVAAVPPVPSGATAPWSERRAAGLVRADAAIAKADHAAALRELQMLYEVAQEDAAINRRLADTLYAEARYEEAEPIYRWLEADGRTREPDRALAHVLARLSDLAGRKGEADRARELFDEARGIDPTVEDESKKK
jgi:hypothetical protein